MPWSGEPVRPDRFHRTGCRGVTRNEMLALAVLFVVLLGVALPWFQMQTRNAHRTASLQNLRQWGIALNLYLVDHDNSLPAVGTSAADPEAWSNTLPVYLSLRPLHGMGAAEAAGIGLWTDPAARIRPRQDGTPDSVLTYGMNAWIHPDPTRPPGRIHDIEDPTTTFFLVSTAPGLWRAFPGNLKFRHGPPAPDPKARTHVLFCDGHVEEVSPAAATRPEAIQPTANPPARPTWIPHYNAPAPVR